MTSENKLVILSGAHIMGYIMLIAALFSDDNQVKNIDLYKTNYATLFNEIDAIGHTYMNNKIQQTLQKKLEEPETQSSAIRDLVRHELSAYISLVQNKNSNITFTRQEQKEAYLASYNKIINAISVGKWRNEDSNEILQYASKISPKKRIELLELYHNALNNNSLAIDPNVLPPPF